MEWIRLLLTIVLVLIYTVLLSENMRGKNWLVGLLLGLVTWYAVGYTVWSLLG